MKLLKIYFHSFQRINLKAFGLALLASTLLVAVAQAHGVLVKSDPANGERREQSPAQVTAWYSQELETGPSTIQVFNEQGQQVDTGDGGVDLNDPDHASMIVSLPPALPDGIYTVRWVAVSVTDGDLTQGVFKFGVGQEIDAAKSTGLLAGAGSGWLIGGAAAGLGVLLLAGVLLARSGRSMERNEA